MADLDRMVAGMRCREVLERLSAYLDGELPTPQRDALEGHLAGCDRCERFGGAFGSVVEVLRRELAAWEAVPDEVSARLRRRLSAPEG